MSDGARKFLKPAQLKARWEDEVELGTLANWRSRGEGPAFVKIGGKVLYPLEKVEAYEASQMKNDNDNNA